MSVCGLINIPPCEAKILMSRNPPLGAREIQDYRHNSICEWLIPAHWVFGDVGRDATELVLQSTANLALT